MKRGVHYLKDWDFHLERTNEVEMDTIGDFITRIRNAQSAHHEKMDVPSSNMRKAIVQVLKEEGYVRDFKVVRDGRQGMMRVYLKYTVEGEPLIHSLKRVSCPGRRKYVNKDQLPKVRSGYGLAILSTNKGVMSAKKAATEGVGGEYLVTVW